MSIKPTVGRVVYYRGEDGQVRAAIVTQVNGDFNLNLYVFPTGFTDADCCTKENVTHADPTQEPACFPSWHWMPYQVEQAKKAASEIARGDEPKVGEGRNDAACSQLIGSRDDSHIRFQALDMALRTPNGSQSHQEILTAAKAYEQYMRGQ